MRRLFSLLAFVPALAAAQTPTPSADAQPGRAVPIDRVIAIVGNEPILLSEVEGIAQQMALRDEKPYPTDSVGRMNAIRAALDEFIDIRVVLAAAKKAKVEVDETQIAAQVDAQIQAIRQRFPSDAALQQALRGQGFASMDAFRSLQIDRMRDSAMAGKYRQQLQQDGKFPHAPVTEAEVTEFFNANRAQFGKNLGGVTFRQIVIPLQASPAAKLAARKLADSLRTAIDSGKVTFEEVAKKYSADESTRETGGDLGWRRRGAGLVPEFERWIFVMPAGQMTPVFETQYGYHVARVDRVAPGEVKSRHFLIRPVTDSSDIVTTRALADSVAAAMRAGASFDSLAAKYHDANEPKIVPTPIPLDSLHTQYKEALTGLKPGDVSAPFQMPDRFGQPTMLIVGIIGVEEPREYTVDDWRKLIRDDLAYRKGMRKLIDRLRKEIYVSIQL
jgi:peptidyl-prolyl cis-trans isomerase SurA